MVFNFLTRRVKLLYFLLLTSQSSISEQSGSAAPLHLFNPEKQDLIARSVLFERFRRRSLPEPEQVNVTRTFQNPIPEDVKFTLYPNINADTLGQPIHHTNSKSLQIGKFHQESGLIVAIHGYSVFGSQEEFLRRIRNRFIEKHIGVNLLEVDWSVLSTSIRYDIAARNVYFVGEVLAKLIKRMQEEYGLPVRRVHLVGFSLGAHIAGTAGKNLPGLGRITGLDPAGPLFNSRDFDAMLDKTDAEFVDILHTNMGSLINGAVGHAFPTGHVDYLFNGGKFMKGCKTLLGIKLMDIKDFWKDISCSHSRALDYFLSTVLSERESSAYAYKCDSYSQFQGGLCSLSSQVEMRFPFSRPKEEGLYFLETQVGAPFLSHHLFLSGSVVGGRGYQARLVMGVTPPGGDTYFRVMHRPLHFTKGMKIFGSIYLPLDSSLLLTRLHIRLLTNSAHDKQPVEVNLELMEPQGETRYSKVYSCSVTLTPNIRTEVKGWKYELRNTSHFNPSEKDNKLAIVIL